MRKTILFITFLSFIAFAPFASAQATTNQVVGVKVLPLPDNRVRLIFQFTKKLKFKPASFVMKKPAMLVFDFLNMGLDVPSDNANKKVNIGVLDRYSIVSSPRRLRAVLNLSKIVSYSTSIAGKQFNITLAGNSVRKRFKEPRTFYSKKRVNTRYKIEDVDFRGGDRKGGKLIIKVSNPNLKVSVSQRSSK